MDLWLDNVGYTGRKHRSHIAQWLMCLPVVVVMVIVINPLHAQVNRYLKEGNKFYEQQKYKEAAEDYAKALRKDPNNTSGLFNLGNSLYQQQQFDASRKIMTETEKKVKDKSSKAAANYNIGNTYMAQKKWEDAISAYKQTLRNNPQDADAKYNLSYAQQMMKKEQEQNKDKKDQDKKDQDKKDQQKKDQDKKDQQDDKDKKEPKDKEQQEQQSKLSQQEAENLLNAMEQNEKKLQDKLKKEKGVPVKLQKDW